MRSLSSVEVSTMPSTNILSCRPNYQAFKQEAICLGQPVGFLAPVYQVFWQNLSEHCNHQILYYVGLDVLPLGKLLWGNKPQSYRPLFNISCRSSVLCLLQTSCYKSCGQLTSHVSLVPCMDHADLNIEELDFDVFLSLDSR